MKAVMYHYIREFNPEMPHLRFLHIENFKKQLDCFEKEFEFVDRKDFFNILRGGDNILPSGVVLTFDDGLKDHFRWVLPELKKRNLWGVFYIPTGHYKNQKLLGVHRIHFLLSRISAETLLIDIQDRLNPSMILDLEREKFENITYLRQENPDAVTLFKKLLNYYIRYEFRDQILDELMKTYCSDERLLHEEYYLSPAEIKELYQAGMVVGSHTETHRLMSKISEADQEMEIIKSFEFLEQTTGVKDIKTFCYPYGGFHSFTEKTESLLSRSGVQFSFNVEPRDIVIDDFKYRPQALPRFDCNQFPFGAAS